MPDPRLAFPQSYSPGDGAPFFLAYLLLQYDNFPIGPHPGLLLIARLTSSQGHGRDQKEADLPGPGLKTLLLLSVGYLREIGAIMLSCLALF